MISTESELRSELSEPLIEEFKRRIASWLPHLFVHLGCGNWRASTSSNECNQYAVAVVKDGVAVGNLNKTVSRICSLFVCTGDTTT